MELVVISSPHKLSKEAMLINQLFEAGMKRFHLRKPDAPILEVTALLDQIDAAFLDAIVLHHHHELLNHYGLKRLHYPAYLLQNTESLWIDNQRQSGIILSTSIHNLKELDRQSMFQYVFYSPVFNSISKPGYKSTLLQDFQLNKIENSPDIFALGGIDHHNIHQLPAMNFDGAAVLGAIWNESGTPINNFIQVNQALKQINDR